MSLLSGLKKIFSGEDSSNDIVTERPQANCPSDCTIAGKACAVCEPYKKKLIDKLYYVDHIEEFRNRYEVVGENSGSSAQGTVKCPFCGAPSANHVTCEYCGSQLSDAAGSDKIRVSAASDIPNPIMEAQDVIYERYETVAKQFSDEKSSEGILSELAEALSFRSDEDTGSELGAKMSEAEITEAAALYGVSVSAYLTGLDNGKYLTLAGRQKAASLGNADGYTPIATGVSGIAGIGLLAGSLFGKKQSHYTQEPPFRKDPPPEGAGRRDDRIQNREDRPKKAPSEIRNGQDHAADGRRNRPSDRPDDRRFSGPQGNRDRRSGPGVRSGNHDRPR